MPISLVDCTGESPRGELAQKSAHQSETTMELSRLSVSACLISPGLLPATCRGKAQGVFGHPVDLFRGARGTVMPFLLGWKPLG